MFLDLWDKSHREHLTVRCLTSDVSKIKTSIHD
jgi:hypothetical protein